MTEVALRVPDTHDRKDLGTFLARVSQLDESAVVRLRARGDGRVVIWAATQFDVLACRAVRGELRTPISRRPSTKYCVVYRAPMPMDTCTRDIRWIRCGAARYRQTTALSISTTSRHGQCWNWRSAGRAGTRARQRPRPAGIAA